MGQSASLWFMSGLSSGFTPMFVSLMSRDKLIRHPRGHNGWFDQQTTKCARETMAPNETIHRWSGDVSFDWRVAIYDVSKFMRCREREGERGGAMISLPRGAWEISLESRDQLDPIYSRWHLHFLSFVSCFHADHVTNSLWHYPHSRIITHQVIMKPQPQKPKPKCKQLT